MQVAYSEWVNRLNHWIELNIGHKLETVTSKKDIGVTFYLKLEFDLHINEKINKANGLCAMIRRTYKFI